MLTTLFTLVTLVGAIKSCGDFYWRDYDGVIPIDAIPVGNDSRGTVYIGQGYIHEYALALGTIVPGQRVITVPCYGVKKAVLIKILCGQDKRKYYWLATTNATYAQDTLHKCPILGGYDQRQTATPIGTLHVGRTHKNGNFIIGNIGSYRVDPYFYYPLDGRELRETEFEVLIYNDYPIIHPENSEVANTTCLS